MSRFFLLLLTASAAMAEVVPTLPKSVDRVLPEDTELTKDTGYKKLYNDLKPKLDELQRQSDSARTTLKGPVVAEPPQVPAPEELEAPRQLPKKTKVYQPHRREVSQPSLVVMPATGALTFGVSAEAALDETTTVLPAGSFVKARVVSGVEANTLEPYPVLLQLEYAFTGPNQTKIDLSNCFMIAKARANLSTERVIMETDTMSCVRENGEHFKSAARGYTAGEDSTFGSTGTFISKQGQVLLAAVLASVAKNAGEAVALAQQTTTVVGAERGQSATNVTGDQAKFIAGRSVVDGATLIAQWYLDYAKQLVPSIGIGSGQTVHVIMLDTIRVPTLKD